MYYRLTNFYQNNRKYVKSFDLNQLGGQKVSDASGLDPNCDPLQYAENTWVFDSTGNNVTISKTSGAQYYPCGLIANSLFSGISNLFPAYTLA
jgi:LEM3 (ligand-effect modulator 3) family / CDC50 family